eukprot:15447401-Alexandrium_andersonii.AAC.1
MRRRPLAASTCDTEAARDRSTDAGALRKAALLGGIRPMAGRVGALQSTRRQLPRRLGARRVANGARQPTVVARRGNHSHDRPLVPAADFGYGR